MLEILAGWPSGAVLGLVAVIGFAVLMLTWIIAHHWSSVRLAEMEAALKREFLQRGLSVDEIERLIRASQQTATSGGPVSERELDANLASILVQYEVSAETMEQVVRTFQATDPATKKAVYTAVEEMLESDANEEQVLAAVRTLCTPHKREAVPALG